MTLLKCDIVTLALFIFHSEMRVPLVSGEKKILQIQLIAVDAMRHSTKKKENHVLLGSNLTKKICNFIFLDIIR